jgi:adenylate cyclase
MRRVSRIEVFILYMLVLNFVNIIGVFFTLFMSPLMLHPSQRQIDLDLISVLGPWGIFTANIIGFPVVFIFVFPLMIYGMQVFSRDTNLENFSHRVSRFLIQPFLLSLLGMSGWIITFITHVFLMGYFKIRESDGLLNYALSFPLYFTTGGIVFVTSYYLLDAINRRRYIPILFPDNKISHIRALKIPLRVRFGILFFAVVFNPMVIVSGSLLSAHLQIGGENLIQRLLTLGIVVSSLIISSFFLTFLFSNSLSKPLIAMEHMVDQISKGNFEVQVPVVSSDETGRLGEGLNAMAIGLREREKLRETFGKVVDPRVRDILMNSYIEGEIVNATVLFLDVRGFTALSEGRDPRWVVRLLNRLFDTVTRTIEAHDGLVNKFIGDAVLAVFGAPIAITNHSIKTTEAAFDLLKNLEKLNAELRVEGEPLLKVGIGVHTGKVLAGRIGGQGRMEYTVIGDAVNVASRLESITKEMGVSLLISQPVWDGLNSELQSKFQSLGKVSIRGRTEAVTIYSPVVLDS